MLLFKNTVYRNAGDSAKIAMSGAGEVEIGPPADLGGTQGVLSPGELLVGAVNSCLMNTFFYFAKKADIDILSYNADAEGKVEKGKDGYLFTNVKVQVKVSVNGVDSSSEKIQEVSRLTKKYCLVSNSVACPVRYDVKVAEEMK